MILSVNGVIKSVKFEIKNCVIRSHGGSIDPVIMNIHVRIISTLDKTSETPKFMRNFLMFLDDLFPQISTTITIILAINAITQIEVYKMETMLFCNGKNGIKSEIIGSSNNSSHNFIIFHKIFSVIF